MGLDMYLNRKTFASGFPIYKQAEKAGDPPEIIGHGDAWPGITEFPYGIEKMRVKEITEEVAYWRKANQIHQWFVDNVQGGVDECQEAYVLVEQLEQLVDTCKDVLAHRDLEGGNEYAEERLPTQDGFFFGSTKYDDWYWEDIADTVRQLEPLIAEAHERDTRNSERDPNVFGPSISYYYRSSW